MGIGEAKPEEMPVSKKPAMASEVEHETEAVASAEEEMEEQEENAHVFKKPAAEDRMDEEMGEGDEVEAEVSPVHKKPAMAQDEPEEDEEDAEEENIEEEVKPVVSKKPATNIVEPVRKSITKSP